MSKIEFGENCCICGKTTAEAGGLRRMDEKWYCNGSKSDCWKKYFEEKDVQINRIHVRIICPFCRKKINFKNNKIVAGNCPRCNAEFSEWDDEEVTFLKKKL